MKSHVHERNRLRVTTAGNRGILDYSVSNVES